MTKVSRVSYITMLLRVQKSSRCNQKLLDTPINSDLLRKIRRKAERTWRRTSLMVDFEIYRDLCRKINRLLFEEKKCFYSTKIEECGKDQKKLFKLTENVMGSNSNVNLRHFTSAELLADKFSNYFTRKATIIRNKIISDTTNADRT